MFAKVVIDNEGDIALVNPDFVMYAEPYYGNTYLRMRGDSPCALMIKEGIDDALKKLTMGRYRSATRGRLVRFVVRKDSHNLSEQDESRAVIMHINPDQVAYVGVTTLGGWTLIKGEFGDLWVKGTLDEVGEKLGGVYQSPACTPDSAVYVSEGR